MTDLVPGSSGETVRTLLDGGVLVVWLNRPESAHARNQVMLANLPQPTVAAINGFALGGGLEMALACDMRLIADDAHVGLPEVTRGLVPAAGGTQRLPRIVGYARACELILSGRRAHAREAVEIGLALRAVPYDELLEAATDLARQFAANPEPAVRYAKALLQRSQSVPIDVGRDAELDAMLTLFGQADLG